MCIYLCMKIGRILLVYIICTRCGGYQHDNAYILHDVTCKHEDMLFHKGGVCDTHEILGKTREFHCFELYRSI